MNIERGKYWDEACNPIVTDRCQCEVVNCWAKDMLRRFPTLNPSPDENGIGWYPHRLDKVKVTGPAKVYAMCWLGDIGWVALKELGRENVPSNLFIELFDEISGIQDGRIMHGLEPHTYLFLTKWPAALWIHLKDMNISPIKNTYIGTTITRWSPADFDRLFDLCDVHDWKLWLSVEPLVDETNIAKYQYSRLSQVIVGAETGKNARPCNPDWIRSIRDQCGEAGVPFFLKKADAKGNRILDGQTHDDLAWRK